MITGMSVFETIIGFADIALVLVLISFLNGSHTSHKRIIFLDVGTNILLITVLKANH